MRKKEGILWFLYFAAALVFGVMGLLISLRAAVLAVGCVAFCALLTALFNRLRNRKLKELAVDMDRLLHGEYGVRFKDYEEGETAIVANELAKITDTLQTQAEKLKNEKKYLADSIADISHQIRTPLTALNLTLETMAVKSDGIEWEEDSNNGDESRECKSELMRSEPRECRSELVQSESKECRSELMESEPRECRSEPMQSEPREYGSEPTQSKPREWQSERVQYDNKAMQMVNIKQAKQLTRRMEWLIEALLKLSKLDAGTVEFAKERVSVAQLVKDAAAPFGILMDLRAQTLDTGGIAPDASFLGDFAWSAEAVGNVIKNCVEHTGEGGTIRISAQENAIYTEIVIEDNGEGIDAEDLPHLFERFYKGKNSGGNSVGIGLALTRAILTAQNGTILAENGRECGARFVLRIYKGIV